MQKSTIYFKQNLIDVNGTYDFIVQMFKGTATMMFKTGNTVPTFNKSDPTSYQSLGFYDANSNSHIYLTDLN